MDDPGFFASMPTAFEVVFFGILGLIALVFGLIVWRIVSHRLKPTQTAQATCVGNCSGRDYGMLVEGDRGPLVDQGDILRSFRRGTAIGQD